jgi:hypothetical protein
MRKASWMAQNIGSFSKTEDLTPESIDVFEVDPF